MEDLYEVIGGGTPSTSVEEYWGGDIPWITSADIHGLKDIRPRKKINKKAIKNSATNLVPAGSIIVVTRVGLGKLAFVNEPLCFSQDSQALLVKNNKSVLPEYALYYLSQAVQSFKYKSRGTTISGVTKKQLKELPFPLPPLSEQGRIVAKIEALFSQLDAGTAALKRVQAGLKRYRASVLKAACEGKLVPQDPNDGPVDELLNLLGKTPLQGKDLPPLPDGWYWAKFNDVCIKIQDGTHFSPKQQYQEPGEGKYLYITAKNIKENGIDLSNVTYVDKVTFMQISNRCNPLKGDVLLIKDGVTTGVATVNELNEEICLLSSVSQLRPKREIINPYYLKYFINSPIGHRIIVGEMTGTAIKRIILDKIKKSPIALPPMQEQQRIVSEVERFLSVLEELDQAVSVSLQRATRLRQAVLKRAFEGKLVPQDSNDDPNEKLLESIRKNEHIELDTSPRQERLI